MSPCCCGDPYCSNCFPGNNGCIEAAEDALLKTLGELGLSPEEYELVAELAKATIPITRKATQEAVNELRGMDDYVKDLEVEAKLAQEFSESAKGQQARADWARQYDELNGAPENAEDC